MKTMRISAEMGGRGGYGCINPPGYPYCLCLSNSGDGPHSKKRAGRIESTWRARMIRRLGWIAVLLAVSVTLLSAGSQKPCLTADEASKLVNKDVCVTAYIYDVVQLPDGTRFLDVCTPQTPDDACRFTIVSLWEDHDEVGELQKYRNMNINVRGIVQPMHGRAGMILSHSRQFNGGPPRFRPNPLLARGFNAGQSRPPVNDPNLRSQGSGRAFMNSRDQEARPVK